MKHKLLIVALTTFLMVSYNNCNRVSFSTLHNPQVIAKACSNPSQLQTVNITINIPNPLPNTSGRCPWTDSGEDSNGNLERKNGFITARIEQKTILSQLNGKIVCSLDIETDRTNFKYDDEFVITLNDRMLASSWYYPDRTTYNTIANDPDVPIYQWSKHKGLITHNVGPFQYFCLGGQFTDSENPGIDNFCHWPATEQDGVMTLRINPEKIQSIIGSMYVNEQYYLNFITMGDNDDAIDCRHSDITMNLTATIGTP